MKLSSRPNKSRRRAGRKTRRVVSIVISVRVVIASARKPLPLSAGGTKMVPALLGFSVGSGKTNSIGAEDTLRQAIKSSEFLRDFSKR